MDTHFSFINLFLKSFLEDGNDISIENTLSMISILEVVPVSMITSVSMPPLTVKECNPQDQVDVVDPTIGRKESMMRAALNAVGEFISPNKKDNSLLGTLPYLFISGWARRKNTNTHPMQSECMMKLMELYNIGKKVPIMHTRFWSRI